MAANHPPESILIAIDDHSYCLKGYQVFPIISVKLLIDSYCRYICPDCTQRETLEFFYQSTKLSNQRIEELGIVEGDYIDVRPKTHCTRGACPLPHGQTLPNIHYMPLPQPIIANGVVSREALVLKLETANIPQPPARVEVTIENWNSQKTTYKLKLDTPMAGLMTDYNIHLGYEPKTLRFFLDGERVLETKTAGELDEEGDGRYKLDVFLPMIGGIGEDNSIGKRPLSGTPTIRR